MNRTAKDINTGKEAIVIKDEKWNCKDVTMVDLGEPENIEGRGKRYYTPVLILKNSKGNEILVNYIDDIYSENINIKITDFLTLDEYKLSLMKTQERDKLIISKQKIEKQRKLEILKVYGEYYGKLINDEKVVIGMSKEMCRMSWGNSMNVDEIITKDEKIVVWKYNYKTFLYFENDKLKMIKQ